MSKRHDGVERDIVSSSAVISSPMCSNRGVVRYRSPVSGSMQTMFAPGGARRATSSAAASVAPLEVPTNIPSFCASSRERRNASAPATGTISSTYPAATASSVSLEMKSGAQPCIRCGRNSGIPQRRDAAAEHLCVIWFGRDDLRLRSKVFQDPRNAFEGSTSTEACHPVIESLASEVREDLLRGGPRVHIGVGFILELPAQKPPMSLSQLDGLREHAAALLCRRRQDNLGAQKTQQLAPLNAEALGHRDDERIALLCANHCQPDARIAASCLDDSLSRSQLSLLLSTLNDGAGHTVLDRAHGVERLDLHVHVDARRREPVQPYRRRIADRSEDVLVAGH